MKVDGEVALVTGGANGLGFVVAKHLDEQGAKVVIVDRDNEALIKLPAHFGRFQLDVTRYDDAKAIVANIVEQYGPISILVNNAGVISSEPFVNIMNPEAMMYDFNRFRDVMKLNLESVFIMTSVVVEKMVLARKKGVIVNISSISGRGNEGQTAYSAAKAGVNAMTVTWSKELGRLGIRSNAVAPGFIGVESTHQALNESVVNHIKRNTPLGRFGEAIDVAKAVLSLIENDFINGAILDVNGGLTI